MTSKVKSCI